MFTLLRKTYNLYGLECNADKTLNIYMYELCVPTNSNGNHKVTKPFSQISELKSEFHMFK